jgi:hypothetical protein
MRLWTSTLGTTLLVFGLAAGARADFACSTVARMGQVDPDGAFFINVFRSEVAINSSGDTVFVARPAGSRDKLYLYPAVGAPQVVARSAGPAPTGGTFRSQRAFFSLSVNDVDDVAFFGGMVAGEGVFVLDGGVLETAAVRSQASPAGGAFDSFPMVGSIDAASRVPFVASVDGGPSGSFVYAASTDTLSPLVLNGTPTLDGRQVCSIKTVDLGNGSFAALKASSKVNCADNGEAAKAGVFLVSGAGISTVALNGDGSPLGGSTFAKFLDTPRINASNDVAFRATTLGTTRTDGIFVWHYASDTITTVVRKGDAAPDVGGSISANQSFRFADTGDVFLDARLRTTPARFGVFDYGATDASVIVKTSAVPTDAFGAGAKFTTLGKTNGTSHDGNEVGIYVRVKDTAPPAQKAGVIRCAGSPSGAFVDGEAFF